MACLQMVLFRRTGKLFDQEGLGARFGVKVPENKKAIFTYDLAVLTAHNFDEGISTMDAETPLNAFFSESKLNLRARSYRSEEAFLENLATWTREALAKGDDLWIEYAVGEKGSPGVYLHDSLIDAFDPERGTVTIVDPDPESRNVRQMPLEELADRISGSYGKPTGILRISEA